MSNFCKPSIYNPKKLLKEKFCPFNALYWDFMERHIEKLKSNPRLFYVYSTWDRFATIKKDAIRKKAHHILKDM